MHRDLTGQTVGNYSLMRALTSGTWTTTYLGEHIHLRFQAAIKILDNSGGVYVWNAKDLFLTNARLLVSLSHPHIIRVLDFGLTNELAFFVTDYAPHGSLATLFQQTGPFSLSTTVAYLKQAASALDYIHSRGIVHGALMPHKMLLGHNHELLLAGFDSQLISNLTMDTDMHGFVGTPVFVAPELIQGAHPTPASDQYTLATIVYLWLSGRRLFSEASTAVDMALQHLQAPMPSLHQFVPNLPPGIDPVIRKALAKVPKDRFPSLKDFADALETASQPEKASAVSIFFSYSEKDEDLRDELEVQLGLLKRRGLIQGWHKRQIGAGEDWATQIDEHLDRASIILLLISPNFIDSDYCYDIEMKRALERHARGETKVIPILLRPVEITHTPFAKLQALPMNRIPITSWRNRDEAFFEVATGIREVVEELVKGSS